MADNSVVKELVSSFCKYLIAGGIAFVVDFSALSLCTRVFGVHYLLASTIGFTLGLIVTYFCSNKFVFSHRKMGDKQAAEFTIFTVIGLVGLVLTNVFMWLFVSVCAGVWSALGLAFCAIEMSKLVTEALVLLWNFGARKIILY